MKKTQKKCPVVITGPTASGKTKLAINLAKKINAEIISADSRCVYKGLDIVSAKPTNDERQGVKHHLIDIMEPLNCPYSAGDFAGDAKKIADEIYSRGKNVIIAGGTWFYIKCLTDDKLLPEIGKDEKLRGELEQKETDELFEILKKLDEKRAENIHKNNKERVIRAIEMAYFLNGKKIEEAEREDNDFCALWFSTKFALNENREELYERINSRVDEMVSLGLITEFKRMKEKYGRTKVLENTIGYKEFFELEDGVWKDEFEAVEKIKQRTRNFAKRQLTFFKTAGLNIIDNEEEIIKFL